MGVKILPTLRDCLRRNDVRRKGRAGGTPAHHRQDACDTGVVDKRRA